MVGVVNTRQAEMSLPFQIGDRNVSISFTIDTGFAGSLTPPIVAIEAFGFPLVGTLIANLADDSQSLVNVYRATILWDGEDRAVEILGMGKRPLLGVALLYDNDFTVRFRSGGAVSITPID